MISEYRRYLLYEALPVGPPPSEVALQREMLVIHVLYRFLQHLSGAKSASNRNKSGNPLHHFVCFLACVITFSYCTANSATQVCSDRLGALIRSHESMYGHLVGVGHYGSEPLTIVYGSHSATGRQETERRRESFVELIERRDCERALYFGLSGTLDGRLIGASRGERRKDGGWGLAGRGRAPECSHHRSMHGSPIDRQTAYCSTTYTHLLYYYSTSP